MPLHKYILLSVALLSFVTEVRAQIQPTCTVSITVADTIFVPDPLCCRAIGLGRL